jgi:hypothetical protein
MKRNKLIITKFLAIAIAMSVSLHPWSAYACNFNEEDLTYNDTNAGGTVPSQPDSIWVSRGADTPLSRKWDENTPYRVEFPADWDMPDALLYPECPVFKVTRTPYPRTLVNVPTTFIVHAQSFSHSYIAESAPISPKGSIPGPEANHDWIDATGEPLRAGIKRNFRLRVLSINLPPQAVWPPVNGTPAGPFQWDFEDRPWNKSGPNKSVPQIQPTTGISATYTYRTSSTQINRAGVSASDANIKRYGRPVTFTSNTAKPYANHRFAEASPNLPAYPVHVGVNCAHYYRLEWEESTYWHTHPDGTNHYVWGAQKSFPNAAAATFNIYGANPYAIPGWIPVDLRTPAFGNNPFGYTIGSSNFEGQDGKRKAVAEGKVLGYQNFYYYDFDGEPAINYWDLHYGVWVPVLEVQTVMRRCNNGACEFPTAP